MPTHFDMTVVRLYSIPNIIPFTGVTLGKLLVNGEFTCFTLEPLGLFNVNNISSVPTGTYTISLRYDQRQGFDGDGWRFQLGSVPGRDFIQIHAGRTAQQVLGFANTAGCILIGDYLNVRDGTLEGSFSARDRLKLLFYGTSDPVQSPNLDVSLAVREAFDTGLLTGHYAFRSPVTGETGETDFEVKKGSFAAWNWNYSPPQPMPGVKQTIEVRRYSDCSIQLNKGGGNNGQDIYFKCPLEPDVWSMAESVDGPWLPFDVQGTSVTTKSFQE